MQKGPQQNRRKRSGPPASTRLPKASNLASHHATAGEPSHLGGHGDQKASKAPKRRRGALHPLSPDGETNTLPQAAGESSWEEPTTATSAATRNPSSTKELEEVKKKTTTAGGNSANTGEEEEGQLGFTAPRHHGRPGRRKTRAAHLHPTSPATTAGQGGKGETDPRQ
jgi:hypothetical protein